MSDWWVVLLVVLMIGLGVWRLSRPHEWSITEEDVDRW